MAAGAITRFSDEQAMAYLKKCLVSSEPSERRLASFILADFREETDVVPLLLKSLELSAGDPSGISMCHNVLAVHGNPIGVAGMKQGLASEDAGTRAMSAYFEGEAQLTSAADTLVSLLDDPDLDVRVRAAHSLLLMGKQTSNG